MAGTAHPASAVLRPWLRALWDIAPGLHRLPDGEVTRLSPAGVHLPEGAALALDAAAHAGAHLVYSRPGASTAGLRPATRVLAGVLEDARVEWLAGRELPGLRRRWTAWHTATPADGDGVVALVARLSRALADPAYADPHPWVAKGRALCFLDREQAVLALGQFDAVRQAASRLGHDLGQMRLPLAARTWRPPVAYRDDNTWLWTPDAPEALAPAPGSDAAGGAAAAPVPAVPDAVHRYPEWDRRIARHRADWATVREGAAPAGPARPAAGAPLRQRVDAALRARGASDPVTRQRAEDGDVLHLGALVDAWTGWRAGGAFDPRVFHRPQPARAAADVLLLLDASASAAEPGGPAGHPRWEAAATTARVCAEALGAAGHACAIRAFSSEGRHAVQVQRVKDFDDPADGHGGPPAWVSRLGGLAPGGSTRLGAAVRHATAELLARPGRARHLVIVSDGEPHDVDVAEPGYLAEDARDAVRTARRRGVQVFCFALHGADRVAVARIFGPSHHPVDTAVRLPAAVARLRL